MEFYNVGYKTTFENKELVKQVLECLDFDFDEVSGSDDSSYFTGYEKEGSGFQNYDEEEIFSLLNKLFGPTWVYSENETNSGHECNVDRHERILDPEKMIAETKDYNYDCDNGIINEEDYHTAIDWEKYKEELEELAKEQGVEPSWTEKDGRLFPNEEDFARLIFEYNTYRELSMVVREDKLELTDISNELKDDLINGARERGYSELLGLISEKLELSL